MRDAAQDDSRVKVVDHLANARAIVEIAGRDLNAKTRADSSSAHRRGRCQRPNTVCMPSDQNQFARQVLRNETRCDTRSKTP